MRYSTNRPGNYATSAAAILALLLIMGGCGSGQDDGSYAASTAEPRVPAAAEESESPTHSADTASPDREADLADPGAQAEFWSRLHEHCGEAFEGRLVTAAPGFDLLDGSERVIVHFRSCSDFETRLPFHIEEGPDAWDRSRTWVFFNHGADGLELRHDHRHQDGSEEENTWYGGDAIEGGTYWQRFIYPPRTEEMGVFMGWRVEIHPDERFTYGTMRDDEWTFRVDFDLSRSVELPPPPWGF
jgi:hypothetical protein